MATPVGEVDSGTDTDQILDTGTALLSDFIVDRVRRHGPEGVTVTYAQLGGTELRDPARMQFAQSLRRMGDELDNIVEIQGLSLDPTREAFIQVASEVFSDGKFNWGRVVVLFYFASCQVIKALVTNVPDIIRTIISWTMEYIRDHLVNWIREQGGWEGVKFYFATTNWKAAGVILASVLGAFFILHKI